MASPSNSSRSGPAARGSRPAVAAGSHDPSPAPARLRADTTAAPDSQPRWPLLALWAIAGAVVVVGVAGQLWRPVAPDLGPPPDPRDLFDAAHLARVQAYQGPKRLLGLLALAVQVGVPVAAVVTRRGRRAVDAVARRSGGERRPALAAAAVGVAVVAATELAVLPLAFWSGFVHDGAFGLRTQGLAGWAGDRVLALAPALLLTAVGLAVASVVVRRLPRAWPPLLGLAAAGLAAVVVTLSPLLLEPLRFDFTPLPQGQVRDRVTALLERADVQVDALLVADASRRTTRQNAYVSGLGGTRRVVLYDTLLAARSPAEIGAVFAHELAHHLHRDVPRGTLLGAAGTILATAAVAAALRRQVAGGRLRAQGDPRGAAVVVAVVVVLSALSLPLQQLLSRRAEAAADHAALQLAGDPAAMAALIAGLAHANLTDPAPPAWAYLLWSSHPTPAARLGMAARAGAPLPR